jgi:hypothetical protein
MKKNNDFGIQLSNESNCNTSIDLFTADPSNLISEAKQLSTVLNNISRTLQVLEDNLREMNANFPYLLEVEKDPESHPKKPELYHSTSSYDIFGYRTQIVWYIAWEEDEDSKEGKFRLFLIAKEKEIIYYHGMEDNVLESIFQTKYVSKIALRQTKIHVRLRFSKHLCTFIKSFEDNLKNYRNSIEKNYFNF